MKLPWIPTLNLMKRQCRESEAARQGLWDEGSVIPGRFMGLHKRFSSDLGHSQAQLLAQGLQPGGLHFQMLCDTVPVATPLWALQYLVPLLAHCLWLTKCVFKCFTGMRPTCLEPSCFSQGAIPFHRGGN